MRSKIITLALVAGLGTTAFAATDTSGVIKSIDVPALTVTLEDGSTYHLPLGFDAMAFKAGEKVVISWEAKGALKEVMGMKAS